jgi:Cu-Zn family superoxide dismutase
MDLIFYKEKYSKYKSKYLESKKFVHLDENLVGMRNHYGNGNEPNDNFNPIRAIGFFNGDKICGTVIFEELPNDLVNVSVNLSGFEPNTIHGFHVHESGDLSKGCDSMCAHFNPFNKIHGGRTDEERHVGDLGNITADNLGNVQISFTDHLIKLRGDVSNIIGRGLIVHANPDDCGKTSNEQSKITGNSGKRIGCAIIGYASCTSNK